MNIGEASAVMDVVRYLQTGAGRARAADALAYLSQRAADRLQVGEMALQPWQTQALFDEADS